MPGVILRALIGFLAAVLSVLIFHQGMIELLHWLGLTPGTPYRTTPVPPFGVPAIVSLCFWGGLYGALFGAVWPKLRLPSWLAGVSLGVVAALVGMSLVAWLKHRPIANGWHAWPIARSLLLNGFWGLGLGLILPLLQAGSRPRPLARHPHHAP